MSDSDSATTVPVQNTPDPTQPLAVYDIPAEGSLGLLALGARGVIAWREKRVVPH